jgi:hypothetical protein
MSKKRERREHIGGDYIEATIGDSARDVVVGKDIDVQKVTIGGDVRESTVVTAGRDVTGRGVVREIPTSIAFERIAAAATLTLRQLERNYEQARNQANNWSRISLIAAGIGFLMVLAGIVQLLLGNTTVGIVTSVSGIVPEIAAALFFNQVKDANARVDAYHKNLLEAEAVHRAIELCETIEDNHAKERLKETVIKQVLGVSESTGEVTET